MCLPRDHALNATKLRNAGNYITEYRDTASKVQSQSVCPLEVNIGYIKVKFNKTGISTSRLFPPETDETSTWSLLKHVNNEIKQLETSNDRDHFCKIVAEQIVLLAGTDYASTSILDASSQIKGNEILIDPIKRTNQLASSLESLEILQKECHLNERLILRSQQLLFERFNVMPTSMFTFERMPCVEERCVEDDELEEFVRFAKINFFIVLVITFGKTVHLISNARKSEPPSLEISESKQPTVSKHRFLTKVILASLLIVSEVTMISLPVSFYEKAIC